MLTMFFVVVGIPYLIYAYRELKYERELRKQVKEFRQLVDRYDF